MSSAIVTSSPSTGSILFKATPLDCSSDDFVQWSLQSLDSPSCLHSISTSARACSKAWCLPSINSVWRFTSPFSGRLCVSSSSALSSVSFDSVTNSALPSPATPCSIPSEENVCSFDGDRNITSCCIVCSRSAFSVSLWTSFSVSWSQGCSFPSISNVWRFTKPFWGISSSSCSITLSSPFSTGLQVFSAETFWLESPSALRACSSFAPGEISLVKSLFVNSVSAQPTTSMEIGGSSNSCALPSFVSLTRPAAASISVVSLQTESSTEFSFSWFEFPSSPASCTNARNSRSFFDTLRADTSFFMSSLTFCTRASTLTEHGRSVSDPSPDKMPSASLVKMPSLRSRFRLLPSPLSPRWSTAPRFKLSRCFSSYSSLCFLTTPGSGSSLLSCSFSAAADFSFSPSSNSLSISFPRLKISSSSTERTSYTPSSKFRDLRLTNPLSRRPCKSLGRPPSELDPAPLWRSWSLDWLWNVPFSFWSHSVIFSSLAAFPSMKSRRYCILLGPRSRNELDLWKLVLRTFDLCIVLSSLGNTGTELTL